MGCGGSKDIIEGIEEELDESMEELGIETIDAIFKDASLAIANLEKIRAVVIDERADTIIKTGACSHVKPDIEHCFKGMLLKISADNKGSFLAAGFDINLDSGNFVTVTGQNNSNEAKDAINSFTNYLKGLWGVKDNCTGIYDNVKGICDKINENKETFSEEIKTSLQDNPLSILSTTKKLTKNYDKVAKLIRDAPKIPAEVLETVKCVKGFPALIKDVKFIAKVDEDAKKAVEAGKIQANQITWFNYDEQSKYGKTEEEGKRLWVRKRDAKKAKRDQKQKKKEQK